MDANRAKEFVSVTVRHGVTGRCQGKREEKKKAGRGGRRDGGRERDCLVFVLI